MIVALLEAVSLGLIGALHMYWAFGGRWAADVAVPSLESRPLTSVFKPTPGATLAVAGLLFLAALVVLERSGWTVGVLPAWMSGLGIWVLSAVFVARSLGEFRYVGWFKRVKTTRFAVYDTRVFTPLTTLLAISSVFVALS
jgi:hypothetical protein